MSDSGGVAAQGPPNTGVGAAWPVTISGSITIGGTVAVTQSGAWSVGRTWALSSSTDSVAAVQSGTWTVAATQSGAWSTGRTWVLASGTDSVAAVQSGTWTVAATQSGAWSTGRTWTLGPSTDGVASSAETGTIYNGTTALTPLFAEFTGGANGDNSIVAAVAGKRIRVLSLKVIASAAVNAFFRDAAAGTQIDGTAYLAANGGYVLPFSQVGWFQTSAGNALVLNLSAAVNVGVTVVYVTV